MTLPDAVEPDDRVEAGRREAEGEATLPDALPVPESAPDGRRNELDRCRFESAVDKICNEEERWLREIDVLISWSM